MTDATTTLVLHALAGDHPMRLSTLQQFIAAHLFAAERLWWAIFLITGMAMLILTVRGGRGN